MIPLDRLECDDPELMDLVEVDRPRLHIGIKPAEVYTVRIRDWFDSKWCYFSGQTLGTLGISDFANLTLPSFVPNRVMRQDHYLNPLHPY